MTVPSTSAARDPAGTPVRYAHPPDDHLLHQMAMRVAEPGDADAVIEIDLRPALMNGHGALQGGLLATLVDVVGGHAVRAGLERPSTYVTRDLTIHYLAALRHGPVRAEGRVRRRSGSSVAIQVDVCNADGTVGAIATITFAVRPV